MRRHLDQSTVQQRDHRIVELFRDDSLPLQLTYLVEIDAELNRVLRSHLLRHRLPRRFGFQTAAHAGRETPQSLREQVATLARHQPATLQHGPIAIFERQRLAAPFVIGNRHLIARQ